MNNNAVCSFKNKLMDTLRVFDSFCTEHGFNYYACSGTAIGAVRHHNIIPWDDDIDVYMLREDYDNLINHRDELNNSSYGIKCLGDDGYIYGFSKFYDKNTTLIEYKSFPTCLIGVYIDIFPLDYVSGDLKEISCAVKEFKNRYKKFQYTYYQPTIRNLIGILLLWRIDDLFHILTCTIVSDKRKKNIRNFFIQMEKQCISQESQYLFCFHGQYSIERELLNKEWFDSYIYMPFGNTQIRLNNEYDKYLSHFWGNYMTPPPIDKQVTHHFHYYLNLKEGLTLMEVNERIKRGEHLIY